MLRHGLLPLSHFHFDHDDINNEGLIDGGVDEPERSNVRITSVTEMGFGRGKTMSMIDVNTRQTH